MLVAAIAAGTLALSSSLWHFDSRRLTNDEAHYAWKVEALAERPERALDSEMWRRHPPAVPAATALIARATSVETALATVTRLALLLALAGMAVLAWQLSGPLGAAVAAALLALDSTVRSVAIHYLLDVPLLVPLLVSAALWLRGGRARRAAVAVSLPAVFVKTYGVIVPCILAVAAVYERLRGRQRAAFWGAAALCALSLHFAHRIDWVADHVFWLQPYDVWEAAEAKLYHFVYGFAWLLPGTDPRARWLAVLLLPILAATARGLRRLRPAGRDLLLLMAAVPAVPLAVSNVTDPRMLILVLVPVQLAMAATLDCAVARLSPNVRRPVTGFILAGAAAALLANDAVRDPGDPCRWEGQWELTRRFLQEPGAGDVRVFSNFLFQLRFFGDLEFEENGGSIYGYDEHRWIPRRLDRFREVASRREAYLLLVRNDESRPPWLEYDPETAAVLRRAGFHGVDAVYGPAREACTPETPEQAAERDAFFAAFGFSRVREGEDGRREELVGLILHRDGGQDEAGVPPGLRRSSQRRYHSMVSRSPCSRV